MKSNEEFWNEATLDRAIFKGINLVYFVDNGYKVELHNNGNIEIYCTITSNETYRPITTTERNKLFEIGFDLASLQMVLAIIEKKISEYGVGDEATRRVPSEYIYFRDRYAMKLSNLLNNESQDA
jgi:hypothetical protein